MSLADTFEVAGFTLLVHTYEEDGRLHFHCQEYVPPKTEEIKAFQESIYQATIKVVDAVLHSKGWVRIVIESGVLVTPSHDGMNIEDFSQLVKTALGS